MLGRSAKLALPAQNKTYAHFCSYYLIHTHTHTRFVIFQDANKCLSHLLFICQNNKWCHIKKNEAKKEKQVEYVFIFLDV